MADETNTTETPNSTDQTSQTTPDEKPAQGEPSTTPETKGDDKIDLGGDDADDKSGDDDDKKAEPSDEDKARAELFGAPEGDAAYEIGDLPEGIEIDKEALEAVAPTFKELGLSNKGASKVAAVYAEKVLPIVGEKFKANLETQIVDQRREWENDTLQAIKGEVELKTASGDKIDFGGAGVKQVQQVAAKALDRIAPVGFRDFLKETGLGQHPAMVAFAFRVGQLISEDQDFGGGGGGDTKPKSETEKFYGR